MSVEDARDAQQGFLRRWSQRKLAAAREGPAEAPVSAAPAVPAPAPPAAATPAATDLPPATPAAAQEPPLPDVASLTFDSDFAGFLAPRVDEGTRRAALRKLFSDPRFNVMDGLDVYIDDYSRFEPVTPDVLAKLEHARYLFDPPQTRVNAQGHVEDVVDEEPAAADAVVADAGAGSVPDAGTAPAGVPDPQLPVAPERPDVPQDLSALRREPDTATPPPGRSARDEPPPTPAPPA